MPALPLQLDPEPAAHVLRNYRYCEYTPLCRSKGRWNSSALLFATLPFSKQADRLLGLLHAIQEGVGKDRTVWGVKLANGEISWELYFYNDGKMDSPVSPANLARIFAPFMSSSIKLPEHPRSMMCSIDVSTALLSERRLEAVNVYVHNVEERPTGISYRVDERGIRKENDYAYYRWGREAEMKPLLRKLRESLLVDFSRISVDDVLRKEYLPCGTVCIANKLAADAIYFSGIDLGHFVTFLRAFDYPGSIIDFVETNRERFDYLMFDVGWDYRGLDGKLEIVKSAYYGTF
jgi:hypothetical protein